MIIDLSSTMTVSIPWRHTHGQLCYNGCVEWFQIKWPCNARITTVKDSCVFFLIFFFNISLKKKQHPYYAHIQWQFMITGSEFWDLLVIEYTANEADLVVQRIEPDIAWNKC